MDTNIRCPIIRATRLLQAVDQKPGDISQYDDQFRQKYLQLLTQTAARDVCGAERNAGIEALLYQPTPGPWDAWITR